MPLVPVRFTIKGTPAGGKADASRGSVTDRPYLSHSRVAAFQACPLRWHFAYVERAEPESVAAVMVFGASVHAALQRHLESELTGEASPSTEELLEAYRRRWWEEASRTPIRFARGADQASLESAARRMIEAFRLSPYASPRGEILGIEEPLRARISPGLPDLLVRPDFLEHRPGELVITDFKTARSAWSSITTEERSQQLLLYAHAAAPIARELGARITLRFVIITRADKPQIEPVAVNADADRLTRTLLIVRRVYRAMTVGHVYPSPSPVNCGMCPYPRRCERWHQSVR